VYVTLFVLNLAILSLLSSLMEKVTKRSRANDIHHVRSFTLIELCADDFSAVEP
jgi:hypothetical protein